MKAIKQKSTHTRHQYLQKARNWCYWEYRRLRKTERCHCSFSARDAMMATQNKFIDLGTFGVEGWCDEIGSEGASYLNTGESYYLTIVFTSWNQQFRLDFPAEAQKRHAHRFRR